MAQTKAQLIDGKSATIEFSGGSSSAPAFTFTGDTNTGIYSPGADQVAISTGGSGRLFVDSSGRVGIGSTSPGTLLDLRAASNPSLHISTSGYTPDYRGYSIDLSASQQTAGINFSVSSPSAFLDLYAGGSAANLGGWNGQIRFFTGGTDAYGTERARIDSSGRLLVGTSSDLSGGVANTSFQLAASSGSGVSTLAQIYSFNSGGGVAALDLCRSKSTTLGTNTTVANNDYIGSLNFKGANGSSYLAAASVSCEIDGAVSGGGANDMPGRLVFSTTADGASSPTERMRIDNAGNLIKKPGPAARPTPNAGDSGFYSDNGYGDGLSLGNTFASGGKGYINFFYNTTIIGNVTSVGTTGVAYNITSDYRLKENVTAVTDGITRLQQLKPSRFNFIADPDHIVDGFIAHEAQTVVPEAVTGEKDAVDDEGNPIYQGIDQSKLVPLLTAALQELVAEVESLKAEVAALKAQ